jgi:hypothetical protein
MCGRKREREREREREGERERETTTKRRPVTTMCYAVATGWRRTAEDVFWLTCDSSTHSCGTCRQLSTIVQRFLQDSYM